MTQPFNLPDMRNRLHAYFEARARERDLILSPAQRPERDLDLAGRLFEEEQDGRAFVVAADASTKSIDGFTKWTGLDFDVELLYVSTGLDEAHFPLVWRAYVTWMHDRASADQALEPLGAWLVRTAPRGKPIPLPSRKSDRGDPFEGDDE